MKQQDKLRQQKINALEGMISVLTHQLMQTRKEDLRRELVEDIAVKKATYYKITGRIYNGC